MDQEKTKSIKIVITTYGVSDDERRKRMVNGEKEFKSLNKEGKSLKMKK